MTNQTSFEIDTKMGAGTKRSLEGAYPRQPTTWPRITPDSISTCTAIIDRENRSTGVSAWHLIFAPYTPHGKPVDVTFARDDTVLTMFMDEHKIVVPRHLKPLHVNWRVTWRKVGVVNVCRVIEKLEDAVTDKTAEKTKTRSELDDEFDRTPDGKPAEYPAWVKKATWWESANNVLISQGFTDSQERGAIIHATFGMDGKSMNDYRGTESDVQALKKVKDRGLLIETGNAPRPDLSKATEPPAPETPTTNATPVPAISLPEPLQSGMSEAGFSMNFFWVDADGAETQFTMREATWQTGLANVESFKAGLRKLGYMPKAEYQRKNGAPANTSAPGAPSPAESDKGAVKAMMIKVVSSFNGGKPQLEFEVEGFEHPLRYTKESAGLLAQLLKDVRKLDGTPFTAADMETGKKHIGNWTIDWQKAERDGKTYYNVMRVRAA